MPRLSCPRPCPPRQVPCSVSRLHVSKPGLAQNAGGQGDLNTPWCLPSSPSPSPDGQGPRCPVPAPRRNPSIHQSPHLLPAEPEQQWGTVPPSTPPGPSPGSSQSPLGERPRRRWRLSPSGPLDLSPKLQVARGVAWGRAKGSQPLGCGALLAAPLPLTATTPALVRAGKAVSPHLLDPPRTPSGPPYLS